MKKYILILLSLVSCGILQAHPLGIFSVNRYTRIELEGTTVRLVYVTDVAEIPSIREFENIDLNKDGNADDAERKQYDGNMIPQLMAKFRLVIDGKEVSVLAKRYELAFPEGQGGLK